MQVTQRVKLFIVQVVVFGSLSYFCYRVESPIPNWILAMAFFYALWRVAWLAMLLNSLAYSAVESFIKTLRFERRIRDLEKLQAQETAAATEKVWADGFERIFGEKK
jgi:RsiW-degrading membrane proteinase PrsW (M82 family)